MNNFFFAAIVLMATACNSSQQLDELKKAQTSATYYHWVSGVSGGGKGMMFMAKFTTPETSIQSDSMWVNEVALPSEVTRVGDTLFTSGFYFLKGNPEAQSEEERMPSNSFLNASEYQGKLRVFTETDTFLLPLGTFKKVSPPQFPM